MRRAIAYVGVVLLVGLVIYALQPPKPIGEGDRAPEISLQLMDGESRPLSSYRGQVVVLDFWATWCAPCQFTMPKMIEFHNRHQAKGVTVIGVAVDFRDPNEVKQFVQGMGINYPIALDAEGKAKQSYQVTSLPTLFVIDRQGNIQMRMEGYDPQNTDKLLEEVVQKAL